MKFNYHYSFFIIKDDDLRLLPLSCFHYMSKVIMDMLCSLMLKIHNKQYTKEYDRKTPFNDP